MAATTTTTTTRDGEYWTTISRIQQKMGYTKTSEDVMYLLYFLYDSQYTSDDLKKMADLIQNDLKRRNKL